MGLINGSKSIQPRKGVRDSKSSRSKIIEAPEVCMSSRHDPMPGERPPARGERREGRGGEKTATSTGGKGAMLGLAKREKEKERKYQRKKEKEREKSYQSTLKI